MALSSSLIKVAQTLIKKFGRTVTLRTVTHGAYNPDTGETLTNTDTTIRAFVGTYQTKDYREGYIELGDNPLYTTSAITKDNKIIIDSIEHTITAVESYSVNTTTVLYVGNLRRL